jgi:hypothetical protein
VSAPAGWTPHRRDDGEMLGWIRPEADLWVPVDLLGREVAGAAEWLDAESVLEERGLGWLAGVWLLEDEEDDARPRRVRIAEVSTERVVVDTDDFGAIDAPVRRFVLPWPAPESLRSPHPGEALPSPWG